MKYKLIEKGHPSHPTLPKKWYPSAINTGKLTMDDFANEIAGRSSLTRGDIENVLENFLDELPTFLKLGVSIQLGNFGTMRLSVLGEGADTPESFKTDTIEVKVIFTPSVKLKSSLDNVTFELVHDNSQHSEGVTPAISLVTDVKTGATDGKITEGGQFVISGEMIKILPENDSSVGIFFGGGPMVERVDYLAINRPNEIVAVLPPIGKGSYNMYIETHYSGTSTPLTTPRRINFAMPIVVI